MEWGARYLGFIFARGHSPETVETALRTAHQTQVSDRAGSEPELHIRVLDW